MNKKIGLILCTLFIIVAVVAIDIVTKNWIVTNLPLGGGFPVIDYFFNIVNVRNFGGAFSILQHKRIFFIFMNITVPVLMIVFLRGKILKSFAYATAVAMICGGSIGNLIDRLKYGYVIDFLQFGTFPVFNGADSFITTGVVFLALLMIGDELREAKAKEEREG